MALFEFFLELTKQTNTTDTGINTRFESDL